MLPQEAQELGGGPIVGQGLRADALRGQRGLKEPPAEAAPLVALHHVEVQDAERADLHQALLPAHEQPLHPHLNPGEKKKRKKVLRKEKERSRFLARSNKLKTSTWS